MVEGRCGLSVRNTCCTNTQRKKQHVSCIKTFRRNPDGIPRETLITTRIDSPSCEGFCLKIVQRRNALLSPPPATVHAGRYEQQEGSTHPTGMHTCLKLGSVPNCAIVIPIHPQKRIAMGHTFALAIIKLIAGANGAYLGMKKMVSASITSHIIEALHTFIL